MRRAFQIIGWLCLLAIVTLSLVSPSLRPVTRLPHDLEHAGIFAHHGPWRSGWAIRAASQCAWRSWLRSPARSNSRNCSRRAGTRD